MTNEFEQQLDIVLGGLKKVLISKNKKYGNSALDPKRIFSKADPVEQIKVRIDDKLSRMAMGTNDSEDTVLDLMGYLVLLKIAEGTMPLKGQIDSEYVGYKYATEVSIWDVEAERIAKALDVEHARYRYLGVKDFVHVIVNIYTKEELFFESYAQFSIWLSSPAETPDDLISAFPNLSKHEDEDK